MIVFAKSEALLSSVEYTAGAFASHLVCDLEPGWYSVTCDGVIIGGGPFKTQADNAISFNAQHGGAFVVAVMSQTDNR